MDTLLQDLRYGLRSLLKNPAFAAAAVAALALGIGANTAIFSAIDAVLLRPLPFPDSDRLLSAAFVDPARRVTVQMSRPDITDLRRDAKRFRIAGVVGSGTVISTAVEAEHVRSSGVTSNLFEVLGIHPAIGRGFLPEDEGPKAAATVVLSHAFWRQRYAGDATVIGKSIVLDGKPATIVGVLAAGVRYPLTGDEPQLYYAVGHGGIDALLYDQRGGDFLTPVARLEPGVTLQQAQAEAAAFSPALVKLDPDRTPGSILTLTPLKAQLSKDVRPALLLLFGAVGLVLLIACANVANLLLARATARQRELAVRIALGATRTRIVRQLFTESLILALTGGAAGVALSAWSLDAMRALAPQALERLRGVSLDGTVLAFTAGASVLTAMLFGLGPSLLVSQPDLHEALKTGARGSSGTHGRLRSALVVLEVALSVALLASAGLLGRTFWTLTRLDPGFRPEGMLVGNLVLPAERYKDEAARARFARDLERALRANGQVTAVAIGLPLPMTGSNVQLAPRIEGVQTSREETMRYHVMSAGTFPALGIALRSGRLFDAADEERGDVALIDEAAAKHYFPGQDPLGRRIRLTSDDWLRIVGVVGNVRATSLEEDPGPQAYVPIRCSPLPYLSVAVRGTGNVEATMRAALRSIDSGLAFQRVAAYDEIVGASLAARRFSLMLLIGFAALALGLAAVGIYGVMSYTVAQRTQELGIRMALGAQPHELRRMVVGEGMRLTIAGMLLGGLGAVALVRAIASMLYGVSPGDPLTYVALIAAVCAVALVACWLPARRATLVHPSEALRAE